ncbi:hypothetical protein ACIBJE_15485 [Micromonospora sp. NPDC050187]|uniref:hypothetical protein n=1 Tax=Micromonospora sp. NPDC050187 TaxID=3364277 RepID=UPI00379383A0
MEHGAGAGRLRRIGVLGLVLTLAVVGCADGEGDERYRPGAATSGDTYFPDLGNGASRRTVGDDAFFTVLRTFLTEYQNGNASTDDFVALAERVRPGDHVTDGCPLRPTGRRT